MKFSEKQVFPGTKVNLTLKASPGSNFAIGAVDKSVHFLRDANDVKAGEVRNTDGKILCLHLVAYCKSSRKLRLY